MQGKFLELIYLERTDATWNSFIYNLPKGTMMQGKFLELTYLERTDATWNSFIYNVPKETMKFVLNSSINTLPTKSNLCLWGKRTNDKCRCGVKETLNHLLNCCQLALNEGRFTYRHDSVLNNYIASCLDKDKFSCFVDIPGHQTLCPH